MLSSPCHAAAAAKARGLEGELFLGLSDVCSEGLDMSKLKMGLGWVPAVETLVRQVNWFVNLKFSSVRADGTRPASKEACEFRGESGPATEACPEAGAVLCDPSDVSSGNGRLARLPAEAAVTLSAALVDLDGKCPMFEAGSLAATAPRLSDVRVGFACFKSFKEKSAESVKIFSRQSFAP